MESHQVTAAPYSVKLKDEENNVYEYLASPLSDMVIDELDLWAVKQIGKSFFDPNTGILDTLAGVSRLTWVMLRSNVPKGLSYEEVRTKFYGRSNPHKEDNITEISEAFEKLHTAEEKKGNGQQGNE